MMPLVGFGTAGLGPNTKQAVKWALEAGYRLLDSAQVCIHSTILLLNACSSLSAKQAAKWALEAGYRLLDSA